MRRASKFNRDTFIFSKERKYQGWKTVKFEGEMTVTQNKFGLLKKVELQAWIQIVGYCRLAVVVIALEINFRFHRAFLKSINFYWPTNALNCIKTQRLKSTLYQCFKKQLKTPTCFGSFVIHPQGVLNVLDWNYLWYFCVRSRCLAAWFFGPVVCVSGATSWEL